MRNTLILLLIATLFATGVAAAGDYHGHTTGGDDSVLVDLGHDDHDDGECDHCCHLGGHLLGIVADDADRGGRVASVESGHGEAGGLGRAAAPPTPPPNI